MSDNLPAQEAVKIIESAFTPLRCVAEIWDYGHRLRFRIFDSEDKPILQMPEVLRQSFDDVAGLESLIKDVRIRLERKGIKLDPWPI